MDPEVPAPEVPEMISLPESTGTAAGTVEPLMSATAPSLESAPIPELSAWERLGDLLLIGGPVVWLLIAMSSVALAIVLLKIWQLHRAGVGRGNSCERALSLWRSSQPQPAIEGLATATQPLPRLLHDAMASMRSGAAAVNVELLREELARRALDTLEQLRSHLRVLEIVASLSPLLGLFGTVLGMIEAFRQMELAGNQVDPGVLSGGIWVALLTTAVGLAVAMPTLMAHSWLERRLDRFRHRMEDGLTQVFTHPVDAEHHVSGQLVQFGKRHAPA